MCTVGFTLKKLASNSGNSGWIPEFRTHSGRNRWGSVMTSLIERCLLDIEWKLRIAQAYEALDQLRHHLQIRTHVFKFKDRFVRGQGANTRARDAISTTQTAIDNHRDTYRVARSALSTLGNTLGHTGWESQLPLLKDSDVRGISDGEDRQSEGRKQLSWIWKVMGVIGEEDGDLHLRDCASGFHDHQTKFISLIY